MGITTYTVSTRFTAIDDMSRVLSGMRLKVSAYKRTLEDTKKSTSKILSGMGDRYIMQGLTLGAIGLGFAFKKAVDEAGNFEAISTSFIPMFNSINQGAKEASQFTAALNKEAIDTAYTFQGLADAAKRLFPNLGGDTKQTLKVLRWFEDAAGGNTEKLDQMSRGYTKGLLRGKFDMRSLNMIAEAGVPIYQELSKAMFGTKDAVAKVFSASRKGQIDVKHINKAFETMTTKGGLFYKSAALYATTFPGMMDVLGESINNVFREIGNALLPAMMELSPMVFELVESAKQWAIANKELIKTEFKAFLTGVVDAFKWIYNNWSSIVMGVKMFLGVWAGLKVVNLAITAMVTGLELVALATGPAGLIVGGLALILWYWNETDNAINRSSGSLIAFQNEIQATGSFWQDAGNFFSASFGDMLLETLNAALGFVGKIYSGFLEIIRLASKTGLFGDSFDKLLSDSSNWANNWGTTFDTSMNKQKLNLTARGEAEYGDSMRQIAANKSNKFAYTDYANGIRGSIPYANESSPYTQMPSSIINKNTTTETKQSNMFEFKITTDNGSKAEVVKIAGASPVKVTTNNSKVNYLMND